MLMTDRRDLEEREQRDNRVRNRSLRQTRRNTKHGAMSELFYRQNTNTATRRKTTTKENKTQRDNTNKIDLGAEDRRRDPEKESLQEKVSFSSQPILVWAVQTSSVLTEQEYSFAGVCSLPVHLESNYMSRH